MKQILYMLVPEPKDEMWLAVVGQEGRYEVSNRGRVRSIDHSLVDELGRDRFFNGRMLKVNSKHGAIPYPTVVISSVPRKEAKRTRFAIHLLVAPAFLGPCPAGRECAHEDGNPNNNRADNLAWKTSKENQADRLRHGTDCRGIRNPIVVFTEAQVTDIWRRVRAGELQKHLALEFKCDVSSISKIICGRNWGWFTSTLPTT